jgi:hypothetical protein
MEFGFDDGKVIKNSGIDEFKLEKNGKARITLIAFKKYSDGILAKKAQERWGNFTDEEKAKKPLSLALFTDQEKLEILANIDKKLAERLNKGVGDLKEIDRLDTTMPKFWMGFTHFKDGLGTIRCLGTYKGSNLIEAGKCCDDLGDAEQKAVTIVLKYPIGEHMQPNMEMMKQRLYTEVLLYRLSAKQYNRLEGTFVEARQEGKERMDLKVTIDGDPKYKKHIYETANCFWSREDFDPEVRAWILDQGLRASKHCPNNLGMELKLQQYLEKVGQSPAAMASGANEDRPKMVGGYNSLID